MMVVWKFALPRRESVVEMPKWAKVLHLDIDPATGLPAVWALVNPQAEKETRSFVAVGTGSDVPRSGVYVASLIDGALVWHLFDTTESSVLEEMLGAFA